MATYREIGGKRSYPKPKDFDTGEAMVEGVYKREINGTYGVQFEFEDEEGEVIVLSSWGQLKYKMGFVSEGDKVKVVYEGQELMPSGPFKGSKVHQFTVLVLDGPEVEDFSKDDQGLQEFGDL